MGCLQNCASMALSMALSMGLRAAQIVLYHSHFTNFTCAGLVVCLKLDINCSNASIRKNP